jgi:transaldolase
MMKTLPRGQTATPSLPELRVKIFADGADEKSIAELAKNPLVKGFTTNPTLMRAAGITDYEAFARRVLDQIGDMPISFEVFADEFSEMERQARQIASWGGSIYVKIPVSNTRGESAAALIGRLSRDGVRLNVTALPTLEQVDTVSGALDDRTPSIISVFAGRIADTGVDPVPIMEEALAIMRPHPRQELIWASPREILNIIQADRIGCHIITVTPDILKKTSVIGRDLAGYSLDTVKMFFKDAQAAGYKL